MEWKLPGSTDSNYISGIFNYCDGWCERCYLSSRCRNFAMRCEIEDAESRGDDFNRVFWKHLSEAESNPGAEGPDNAGPPEVSSWEEEAGVFEFEDAELPEFTSFDDNANERLKDEQLKSHPCARLAYDYMTAVNVWKGSSGVVSFTDSGHVRLDLSRDNTQGTAGGDIKPEEAFEVVWFYHHFIYAKVMRALGGMNEEDDDEGCPRDCDGTAKIALIAIGRSQAAWGILGHYFKSNADGIGSIQSQLLRLRQGLERVFPNAWGFERPGFDTEDVF